MEGSSFDSAPHQTPIVEDTEMNDTVTVPLSIAPLRPRLEALIAHAAPHLEVGDDDENCLVWVHDAKPVMVVVPTAAELAARRAKKQAAAAQRVVRAVGLPA